MSNGSNTTVERLQRELRRTQRTLGIVAIAGGAALLMGAVHKPKDATFGTITAERINIAEPDGLYRMVLTNSARTPGPMLEARDGAKEGTRNFPFAGMIIYDGDGVEMGGYGTGAAPSQGSLGVYTLDWPDGTGEALASFRRIDPEGKVSNGIIISDHPPKGENPSHGVDRRRIKLVNMDRDAQILLADTEGRDRISLRVDANGEARIEVRDAQGNVTFSAPEAKGVAAGKE